MSQKLEQAISTADLLRTKAVEIMTQIQEGVKTAATWSWDQIGDIAYQYVLFQRVYLTILVVVATALVVAWWPLTKWALKKQAFDEGPFFLLPSFGLLFISAPLLIVHFHQFVMVWFAPKIFLITELVKVVR